MALRRRIPAIPMNYNTKAYAAPSATEHLGPFTLSRREVGPHDVSIEIVYCGVCHSDIHQVRNEWGNSIYPMVPGHEMVRPGNDGGRQAEEGGNRHNIHFSL